jgi:hypothetical protein
MLCSVECQRVFPVHATGFHLVILCHRFGRRGRAFAASLARQILNPYEMRLTCFYSEKQDVRCLLEGASSGNSPLVVTTVRVHPDRIMQRAMHVPSVRHEDRCSHVVYLDGDLWFPPDFWRCYGHALAQEPPGYWSAHVMETPTETAERLTDDWQHLTVRASRAGKLSPRPHPRRQPRRRNLRSPRPSRIARQTPRGWRRFLNLGGVSRGRYVAGLALYDGASCRFAG